MAIETWGDKPKSQIDASTVDQEIDAKINDHLADADAHLETGQSLQSHKASEIIDHLAKSIVEDKLDDGAVSSRAITSDQIVGKDIRTAEDVGSGVDGVAMLPTGIEMWQSGEKKVDIPVSGNPTFKGNIALDTLTFNKLTFIFSFESVDTWQKTIVGAGSGYVVSPGLLWFTPGDTAGDLITFYQETGALFHGNSDKNPFFQLNFICAETYTEDFFLGYGHYNPWNPTAIFGFEYDADTETLYAVVKKYGASATKEEISGIDVSSSHIYRAECLESGASVAFYIDYVLVKTISVADFVIDSDWLFVMSAKTNAGGYGGSVFITNLLVSQDF